LDGKHFSLLKKRNSKKTETNREGDFFLLDMFLGKNILLKNNAEFFYSSARLIFLG
jgi:hypothetical protein